MADRDFDPLAMMQKAIDEMRQSIAERRGDEKPSPKVGAVMIVPPENANGRNRIITAHRGELREGDHAEFTLIERKCRDWKLDGSVLFATLEPCAPGARSAPKLSCAERIVNARIKEVWVGIEDDNPTVAGKGIEYLRRNGITVHMFESRFQKVIAEENKTFFEWARQQTEQSKPEAIKLSKYEDQIATVEFRDLSEIALERYRSKVAKVLEKDSLAFTRLLRQQGLLTAVGDTLTPTGFGYLLFGKDPRNALPQAGLLARAELPDGKTSRKEFGEAMVLIPDAIEEWLYQVLPSTVDRSRMERREQVDLPFEMIREAVVNALIHRDYDILGQKCQLVVNADAIRIKSPGGPVVPITLEQLRSFNAPMKSRNPVLHYVFSRMGFAEEQGFGLSSLKKHAEELRLPLPSFSMEGESLVLTIYRSKGAAIAALPRDLLRGLNFDEVASWGWIVGRESITTADLGENMQFDERKAQRIVKKLVEVGLLKRIGAGKSTRYEVRSL
jgi:ATP-dependent DNA helicase RecG